MNSKEYIEKTCKYPGGVYKVSSSRLIEIHRHGYDQGREQVIKELKANLASIVSENKDENVLLDIVSYLKTL
jgi:hypothetical protein